MPGPPPKRKSELRRRNVGPQPNVVNVDDLPDDDPDSLPFKIKQDVVVPDPMADWHPIAREMWQAFQSSATALWWEPSDWMVAKLWCESLSRDLDEQVVGVTESGEVVRATIPLKGASLNAYLKGASMLMLTEADRRRAGIEVERDRLKQGRERAEVVPLASVRESLLGG